MQRTNLSDYQKKKDFLICVDSDGCVMDTMDIKHIRCFGPCMVAAWSLEPWREEVLTLWNQVNLYTVTRGINRFLALVIVMRSVHGRLCAIEGMEELVEWTEASGELSNRALAKAIEARPHSAMLKKTLAWSLSVNQAIKDLPDEEKLPYERAREALAYAHERADIAIVSSANLDAVLEEWSKHGLLEHTDIVLSQNAGSKAFCIGELLKKGYDPQKVLMCGDAPGDRQAAEKNGVFFYPILVRHEKESWEEFMAEGCQRLLDGSYGGEYQRSKLDEFMKNLGA